MPAEIDAYRLAWLEPTSRTVEVEQFCSWSAWRMSRMRSARAASGSTVYASDGTENIIRRKLLS
jgi:hypothetical protein